LTSNNARRIFEFATTHPPTSLPAEVSMADTGNLSLEEKIDKLLELAPMLEALGELLVVQQKDAATVAGVTDDTIRNRVKRGDLSVLSRDGSRLNYLTLNKVGQLKKRRK
jgi:hypothetical protein